MVTRGHLYSLVCVFVRLRIEVTSESDSVAAIEEPLRTIDNKLCASLSCHRPEITEVCVHGADKPATCAVLKLSNRENAIPIWSIDFGSVHAICKAQTDSRIPTF